MLALQTGHVVTPDAHRAPIINHGHWRLETAHAEIARKREPNKEPQTLLTGARSVRASGVAPLILLDGGSAPSAAFGVERHPSHSHTAKYGIHMET